MFLPSSLGDGAADDVTARDESADPAMSPPDRGEVYPPFVDL